MKIASAVLGFALLVITVILLFLLKSGGALKPAGVIKPTEVGNDPAGLIGRLVALRMFPEFHAAENVVWYVDDKDVALAGIPQLTFLSYQNPKTATLHDLRAENPGECEKNCWFIQRVGEMLPELKASDSNIEIYLQYFTRNEAVPDFCEKEKILEPQCVRPISVREVQRKIKTKEPIFFMQRYQKSQFFIFVEAPATSAEAEKPGAQFNPELDAIKAVPQKFKNIKSH